MKIEQSLWIEFLHIIYAQEHRYVLPSGLGTVKLLGEIEKFVISNIKD